ncbi:bacillithiol system redox-active protein YtxJ [Rhodocaloribacter litoris]|uniref:bacillithiol system redox-active protein YtxJ n=1 Tax=Rhodocaloribacter litoris TaxID=2558931 RepID=UPI00141E579C|nr:bacillithiol system redox-active protein YtxJ [Rhodocaloribacter litoris]QXD15581.1 bacillithiol system redox-active protein YtxJ [Rhodocaloribacter litoris]
MMLKKLRATLQQAFSQPDRLHPLEDEAGLDAALDRSRTRPVVLFKHSTWCGTSLVARREMQRLTETHDVPVYEIVVQVARPLSNLVAARFGIRHESPQAIVLVDAQPVYHASHGDVRADTLRRILEPYSPTSR